MTWGQKFWALGVVLAGLSVLPAATVFGQTADEGLTRQELISRQKARQQVNKQLFQQGIQQRQLQIDQQSLLNQQRSLSQQQLRQQQIRGQNRQTRARVPAAEEESRRNELLGQQRGQTLETERRNQQPEVRRTIQSRQQEQNVRKETTTLKSYYDSLNRQMQREQQERVAE